MMIKLAPITRDLATESASNRQIRLEDILTSMRNYCSEQELDLVRKAYVFSAKAHEGQRRHSGEPYMTHPLHVARILAGMQLDVPSVVTGLLHDTVEDTLVTLEEIREVFGESIAYLVDGVTKLGKIHFSSRESRQAENFRKMFLAMAEDIRVILVKLADRLHNMRTLDHLPEEKRRRIALETLEVYAAIAGRLGMQEMKIELEDLAFQHTKPELWKKIETRIARIKKRSHKFIESVQEAVQQELQQQGIKADVQGRFKHHYSIFRKMESQNLEFDQIYDLLAFRVLVSNLSDCYAALGMIHSLWRPVPGRFKDYIGMPKLNNYQSLHTTVIGPEGHRVEFQIRTGVMHEMAEWGVASHWKYKADDTVSAKDEVKFRWLRQFMEWQREVKDPAEYLDIVKLDLFATDVYVFTPKGDIREFPRGSTPIDFAYTIHTDVGHHCAGARINGKIVPLRTILRSGDTVDIITNPNQRPSKDWLKLVQTSRARNKIRQFIRSQQRERAEKIGREILEKEFSKFGVSLDRELASQRGTTFLKKHQLPSDQDLMAQLGYGKLTPHQVAAEVLSVEQLQVTPKPARSSPLTQIIKKATQRTRGIIQVQGMDDILVSLAKCCAPIPGDQITGFVTRGRGVTVHRLDCPRALSSDPERRIQVQWDRHAENVSTTTIRMACVDKPGILAEISKVISAEGVNIHNANCRSVGDQKALNTFEVGVRSVKHLNRLIQQLEKLGGVIHVERLTSA